ncbi:ATP-binding protein [Microbacterium sp. J1-1]|nr:ATP-binding protein [Microbacterium sp. J1-1]UUE20380.1 ATP-binding protein [Microbacterium sp. J1-1]
MRIVVSGTHASGKSTLIADFLAAHPDFLAARPEYLSLGDPFIVE